MSKTSSSQLAANKRWQANHPEKQRAYRYASYARNYIRKLATKEQLEALKKLIDQRLSQL